MYYLFLKLTIQNYYTHKKHIYFVGFSHKMLCKDSRYVLQCLTDKELLCSHGYFYMNYFCFYNHLELLLESRVHPTYTSLLLSYQVIHGRSSLMMQESQGHSFIFHKITFTPFITKQTYSMQSYRFIMTTLYGFQLIVGYNIDDITFYENVSVSIFDGPFLVHSAFLHEKKEFAHYGGPIITCRIDIDNHFRISENKLDIFFRRAEQNITNFTLTDLGETFNISVNSNKRRALYFYKYIRVSSTIHPFVKATFTNIRTFSGSSYNCQYGGFVLSDFWRLHVRVHGPYCSQHGTEPLVNDVTTFHSKNDFLVLIIYSYAFQIDVDILFQPTRCEGLTNACNLFCGEYATYHSWESNPLNYVIISKRHTKYFCSVVIQIKKGCVKVQGISTEGNRMCAVTIYPQTAILQTVFEMQNNFR